MPTRLQPLLHELVTTFAAPTQVLSGRSGDVASSPDGLSAQGVMHADVRVLSDIAVTVDGRRPEHLATEVGSTSARFTGLLRYLAADRVSLPDAQFRLDRHRSVAPGLVGEQLVLSSILPKEVTATVQVKMRTDLAPMENIKVGAETKPFAFEPLDGGNPTWGSDEVSARLDPAGATATLSADRLTLTLTWDVPIPAAGTATVGWSLHIRDSAGAVTAASTPPLDVAGVTARALHGIGLSDHRLQPWLERSLADLNSLRMATTTDPDDTFFAAGAPWYLTLFGRDSIWTARLLLPVDTRPAATTLRTLARLVGTKVDADSAEAPGKIMHELRRGQYSFGGISLPPLYYGTIDATPLWICLLHDAWRAGLDSEAVRELLPTLQAALAWLADYGDADGDGFLEYIDTSGHGLANQGWKDSGDSVRFADGRMAEGPVALVEVQGYAYEAAMSGAALLDAFGLDGADGWRAWAADLARRFREQFWCGDGDGRYPALALDGQKERVDSVTSNIGHLVGTGMLTHQEELLVALRLAAPDMDSGLGLRTMSSEDAGYSPLSYHCGSVWPHDTAIVIAGLMRSGLLDHAAGLVEGLLRASAAFDHRLPELWSGEGRPVPYPAACRPQAWSAAAAVTVACALASR